MTSSPDIPATPRWLHWWAALTVCAALVALVLGSLVTTFKAGMADRYWPTHPLFLVREDIVKEAARQGYAPFLFVIEHSHRAAAWFVGVCAIGLCVGMCVADRRPWMKGLGALALLGVSLQGVLGGLRVLLHARFGLDLATAHGCFAQLVFALLAVLVLCTSAWWTRGSDAVVPDWLPRLVLLTALLVYAQIILGAVVRHSHPRLAQRLHFLLAFAVVVAVLALLAALREPARHDRRLFCLGVCLLTFLTLQVLLGVEAWMMRFGKYVPPEEVSFTPGSAVVRTLHFLFGTLLFTTTTLLTLVVRRLPPRRSEQPIPRPERVLEAIA